MENFDEVSLAQEVDQIFVGENSVLFRPEEIVDGKPPPDAIIVDGIVRKFAFHPQRLESSRGEVTRLAKEIVADQFLKNAGGGWSFLNLCNDRNSNQWAEHPTAEAFLCLAIGLGMAGYCVPKEMWNVMPGGIPYVWFEV